MYRKDILDRWWKCVIIICVVYLFEEGVVVGFVEGWGEDFGRGIFCFGL